MAAGLSAREKGKHGLKKGSNKTKGSSDRSSPVNRGSSSTPTPRKSPLPLLKKSKGSPKNKAQPRQQPLPLGTPKQTKSGKSNNSKHPSHPSSAPARTSVSKERYMGIGHPVYATPPRMPITNSKITKRDLINAPQPPPPPPPPEHNHHGTPSSHNSANHLKKQFSLSTYKQLSKEERRRLLQQVKMLLGEESLLSGMSKNAFSTETDGEHDDEEESLLMSTTSEESEEPTLGTHDYTEGTFFTDAETGTFYTDADTRTLYTMDDTLGDTPTLYTADTSTHAPPHARIRSIDSVLLEVEEELSDEDERFFGFDMCAFSFCDGGQRQEAEEMARACEKEERKRRAEQKQFKRSEKKHQRRMQEEALREEADWAGGGRGRRYEDEDSYVQEEIETQAETIETFESYDIKNEWNRNASGLTVKERMANRSKNNNEGTETTMQQEEEDSRNSEDVEFENIDETIAITSSSSAAAPAKKTIDAHIENGKQPKWNTTNNGEDNASSMFAVYKGETNDDTDADIAEVVDVHAIENESTVFMTKTSSSKSGGLSSLGKEAKTDSGDEGDNPANDANEEVDDGAASSTKNSKSSASSKPKLFSSSRGRSLSKKDRSHSPFVRGFSLSRQKSKLSTSKHSAAADQSVCSAKITAQSICSVKTEQRSISTKTSASTRSTGGDGGDAEKSTKSAKSSKSMGSTTTSSSIIPRKTKVWKEYTDPNTGNKYYSNGIISTWERPANADIVSVESSVTSPTTPVETVEDAEEDVAGGSASSNPIQRVPSTPLVSNKSNAPTLPVKAKASSPSSGTDAASSSSSQQVAEEVSTPTRGSYRNLQIKKFKLFSLSKKNKQNSNKSSNANAKKGTSNRQLDDTSTVTKKDKSVAGPASPSRTEVTAASANSDGNSPLLTMNDRTPVAHIITGDDSTAVTEHFDNTNARASKRQNNASSGNTNNNKNGNARKEKTKAKKGWREYTDQNSGKKYYSDGITTTWVKPANFTGGNSNPHTSGDNSSDDNDEQDKTRRLKKKNKKKVWREYIDSNTGKKYYSNGVTTTWSRPSNFRVVEMEI